MIKKVLLGIAALIVLLVVCVAILAFVAPTDFRVQREIVINKPNAEVFEYAKYLKNQNDWGPWFKKDPAMEQHFKGTDSTVGFVSHWSSQSDEVGEKR